MMAVNEVNRTVQEHALPAVQARIEDFGKSFLQSDSTYLKPKPIDNLAIKSFLSEGQPQWSFQLAEVQGQNTKQKPGPLQSIQTNQQRDQQDLSLPEEIQPSRCQNELCLVTIGVRRYRQAKNKQLCKNCYRKYRSGYLCDFCGQLYQPSSENLLDGKDWIGCDTCDRWNHLDCAQRVGTVNFSTYYCQRCKLSHRKPKKRTIRPPLYRDFLQQETICKKRRIQRVKLLQEKEGLPLFSRGRDIGQNFDYLDSFLTAAGCRSYLTQDALRRDLQRIYLLQLVGQSESISKNSTLARKIVITNLSR